MKFQIIKYLLLLFFINVNLNYSQVTSTYTRYGVGDLYYSYSARTLSMGNTGTAMLNKDYVEILNPASWSGLSRVRFEFSFSYEQLKLSKTGDSKLYGDGFLKV